MVCRTLHQVPRDDFCRSRPNDLRVYVHVQPFTTPELVGATLCAREHTLLGHDLPWTSMHAVSFCDMDLSYCLLQDAVLQRVQPPHSR